jgi:hypothetical protein
MPGDWIFKIPPAGSFEREGRPKRQSAWESHRDRRIKAQSAEARNKQTETLRDRFRFQKARTRREAQEWLAACLGISKDLLEDLFYEGLFPSWPETYECQARNPADALMACDVCDCGWSGEGMDDCPRCGDPFWVWKPSQRILAGVHRNWSTYGRKWIV